MKLHDLISHIDENENVNVYVAGALVSRYDGKDSIDHEYNEYDVERISIDPDGIGIDLYEY